ncbi:MAG: DUF6069 family protein [Chloroflexota bacterium]
MSATTTKQESVSLQQLAIWTIIAAVISAALNAILYLVTQGQYAGLMVQGMEFSIANVIGASIMFIVVGGILLAVLDRFISNPISTWRNVAIVALILSLAQPFIPGLLEGDYTLTTQILLNVMHVIAGVVTIFLLTTRTRA